MANTLGIDFGIDASEFAADLPSVLVWGSQSVTGTRSSWVRDLDAEAEGLLNIERCEWIGVVSDFTSSTLPANNVQVTVGGVTAHTLTRETNEDDAVVRLQLRRRVETL